MCLTHYKLDPSWCYTAPGLAWEAMLKITNVEFQLLTDGDMLIMIQKGVRGGISIIANRYAKANNKYSAREIPGTKIIKTAYGIDLEEPDNQKEVFINEAQFDSTKPTSYIEYLDANSLYSTAMLETLPVSNFQWVDSSHYTNILNNIHNIDKRNKIISKQNLKNMTDVETMETKLKELTNE